MELYHLYRIFYHSYFSSRLSWTSFWSIHSKFWICIYTEAQNQPQFLADDVPYTEFYCLSFEPSYIRFGWKKNIFLFSLYPIVVVKFCVACRQNYLICASLPRLKRLIFSTSATHIFPCETQKRHYLRMNKRKSDRLWVITIPKKLLLIHWDMWKFRNAVLHLPTGATAIASHHSLNYKISEEIRRGINSIGRSNYCLFFLLYTLTKLQSSSISEKEL